MKIKWVVYTVGTRDISNIQSAVPELRVVYDRYRNNFDTFRLALKEAGDAALVLMEDDIELCVDFKNKVMGEILQRPDSFIAFFSGQRKHEGSHYMKHVDVWIQCFYFPPGMAKAFLQFTYLWRNRFTSSTGTDDCLGEFIRFIKGRCYQVVPNLVQHKNLKSEIHPTRSTHRQSPHFIGATSNNEDVIATVGDYVFRNATYAEVYDCAKSDKRLYFSKNTSNYALVLHGEPVAYMAVLLKHNDTTMDVSLSFVPENVRSLGYGSFLYALVENYVTKLHPKITRIVTLSLDMSEMFYRKHGFVSGKRQSMANSDVVYMEKEWRNKK